MRDKTDVEMAKDLAFNREWGVIADRKADADYCVHCGRCEMACTQHLDIISRLCNIAKWEKTLNQKGEQIS
jgi:hypothetical protein